VNHTDPAPPETRPRLAPDAATLRQHLTSELLPALRGALNQPDLAAYLRLTVTHRRPDHGAWLPDPRRHPVRRARDR